MTWIYDAPPKTTKENPVLDEMEGGWRKEGKERPLTPLICTKCQWERRNPQEEEPEKTGWCRDCLDGKVLGHEPVGGRKVTPPPTKAVDVAKGFFG